MTRMPLASASLLALAIALAGCGDDNNPTKAEARRHTGRHCRRGG